MLENRQNYLHLIGRHKELFFTDIDAVDERISQLIENSKFLVVGGAGTIGAAVTNEIFKRNPKCLHVVDTSENNLVELVRYLRSTIGYIKGEFKTFALDCASLEFRLLVESEGPYDYIFNLSALKHVRSEKDPYTLMRMIMVNIVNSLDLLRLSADMGAKNYFCVSTDKAANPVNLMGASKRIMEMFIMRESTNQHVTMARFANVAFSDGSLLHGFNQRFDKLQPLSAPNDVLRYFITPKEAGELCLISGLLSENRDILFPKLSEELKLTKFSDIAVRFLNERGYSAFECISENEAREKLKELILMKKWPCYFFKSDTTGEKDFEEFFTNSEVVDVNQYRAIGVIKNNLKFETDKLDDFLTKLADIRNAGHWTKQQILDLFIDLLPEFRHKETGKYLDQRM